MVGEVLAGVVVVVLLYLPCHRLQAMVQARGIANRAAALAGAVTSPDYNPTLGFATVRNVKGRKYPYDVFYAGLSPRIAAAWNPRIDSGGETRLTNIKGLPPDMLHPPKGCPFALRCPYVFEQCAENPPLLPISV